MGLPMAVEMVGKMEQAAFLGMAVMEQSCTGLGVFLGVTNGGPFWFLGNGDTVASLET